MSCVVFPTIERFPSGKAGGDQGPTTYESEKITYVFGAQPDSKITMQIPKRLRRIDVGPISKRCLTRTDGFFGGPDHLTVCHELVRGGQVPERAMRPALIIVPPPRTGRSLNGAVEGFFELSRSFLHCCKPAWPAQENQIAIAPYPNCYRFSPLYLR